MALLSIFILSQLFISVTSSFSSYGLKKCIIFGENSPKEPAFDENTLQWYDNASRIGSPKPSYLDGKIKAEQF
jgi:uncharacterized protein YodC (DUF2158 family)